MNKKAIVILIILISAIGIFLYYIYGKPVGITNEVKAGMGNTMGNELRVVHKWELPDELIEVSGIVNIKKDHFACVQDENGKIFILKTDNESIEREISFAGDGDYEDIAISGEKAYVIKSDGTLYIINDLSQDNPKTEIHKLPFKSSVDIEGMFLDEKNNRLLLARKDRRKGWNNFKRIYAFDLSTNKLQADPIYNINLNDKIFKDVKDKDVFSPSAIGIHPLTGDLIALEGKDSKLLIMDPDGKSKFLYMLDKDLFPQPEGIAFGENGEIYISNEGKENDPATIYEVKIVEK